MYKKVGLTGGIASGKSVASNYLKDKGYTVLDADIYAKNVLNKGTEGLKKVVEHFGEDVLEDDGTLNRKKLGDIVFNDKDERAVLNNITHPIIRRNMDRDAEKYIKDGHVFSDIPLLYENKLEDQFDFVIVVYVDTETQIKRLMKRNDYTLEEAKARINSQLPLSKKKEDADVVLDNRGSLDELYREIDELLEQL